MPACSLRQRRVIEPKWELHRFVSREQAERLFCYTSVSLDHKLVSKPLRSVRCHREILKDRSAVKRIIAETTDENPLTYQHPFCLIEYQA
jgi:hypothetical protein